MTKKNREQIRRTIENFTTFLAVLKNRPTRRQKNFISQYKEIFTHTFMLKGM